jgi:hypothetical protein
MENGRTRTCGTLLFALTAAATLAISQDSAGSFFDVDAYVDALADERVVTDEIYARRLYQDVERLPEAVKYKIVHAIDRRVPARNSMTPQGVTKTARIPVDWVWGVLPTLPTHVGTTTACGGDNDFRVVFRGISGAYKHPSRLRLQTNSIYVYSLTKYHGNKLTAYKITDTDDVNVCIGMNFIPKTPVGQSIKGMLLIGLGIQ